MFIDFSKLFDSIHSEKMEQILWAYGLFKENITTVMICYKDTKPMVCSLDDDANFFDIVLQGDTIASYMFITYLYNALQISIDLIKKSISL